MSRDDLLEEEEGNEDDSFADVSAALKKGNLCIDGLNLIVLLSIMVHK